MEKLDSDEIVGTSPEVLREQALRRLKKRRDFHAHAFVYLAFNLVIWGIWVAIGATTSGGWEPWPLWITLAWGLGVMFNAWDVYMRPPITEDEIAREIDRLAHRT